VLSRGETRQLDQAARQRAPADFIRLPDGVVHYELQGEPGAQAVILVNGLVGPCSIWDPTFPALLGAGFRVLRYDLYGRGLSDRPDLRYTLDLFVRQLHDLLGALQITHTVNLIGLSMGGPICAGFTARYPDRVNRFCLIDPAGLRLQHRLPLGLVRAPFLGEILVGLLAERVMRSAFADEIARLESSPRFLEEFRSQMQYQGFKRALLSTLRYGPIGDLSAIYRRIGEQGRPTLLLWGRRDRVVPFAHSQTARELMPQAEFHPIEQAGHTPHFEKPELVNPLLIRFLKGY
jgi:pimeloyl-ACP methyl ester carboxylesterase